VCTYLNEATWVKYADQMSENTESIHHLGIANVALSRTVTFNRICCNQVRWRRFPADVILESDSELN